MASSSSSSSTTDDQVRKKYDVFLSFRGDDTRFSFISHLHGGLVRRRIKVFLDDQLNRGHEISQSLMNAIEESIISVVVFSERYASSRWCLEELVKIVECKMSRQIVLPVFYIVDPSDVRNQSGTFGNGFSNLVERLKKKLEKLQMTEEQFNDKVQTWRNALREAANLSGYTLAHNRSEFDLTWNIVRDILGILNNLSPTDYKDLVGIQPIINFIIKFLLGLPSTEPINNVRIIGIWGMGGMGKTTIAEAVFNKIRTKFKASYFARNVRERSGSDYTLSILRQELLSTILDEQYSNTNLTFTKRRLGCKRVIIVFDDVTCSTQIESLIGNLNCLGKGSRIIITTRNKQVLKNCWVDEHKIYTIGGLCHSDALQLFSKYAFRQNCPKINYNELSNRVLKYAKGVPLALKVLGSALLDKPEEVWESAIKKLEIIPHEDIQKVLKLSYDGINDIGQRIFLDIACFLKWDNTDFVKDYFNACNFQAEYEISILIDKCLVTISDDNKITMHDLLQKMGHEIVRQESTYDPCKRSRLWYNEDIYHVLEDNVGTQAIEGICLDMSKQSEIIHLQPNALKPMHKLRFFKLYNLHYEENNINKVHLLKDLNSISIELRYLCWHGCPLKSLQSNFHPRNLVAIDMPHSHIEQLWLNAQLFKLKHIDLSHSKHLRIHDLSLAPNLESLILEGCTNLFKISSSMQCLNKLVILNLRHCKSLHSFPTDIRSESLRKLILSGCSNIETFQELPHKIEELFLDETAIERLPPSIENLSRLVILNLKNCAMLCSLPSNICKLKSLEHVNLSGCSKLDGLPDNLGTLRALKVLKAERLAQSEVRVPSSTLYLHFLTELNLTGCRIRELPNNLGQLSSLESLLLGRNSFESIPTSIIDLSKLCYLDISYCEMLKSLPKFPSQLESIDAHNCTSLEPSSLLILFSRANFVNTRFNFSNCCKLDQNTFNEIREAASKKFDISVQGLHSKMAFPRSNISICYLGNKIPEWFMHQGTGSSITFSWVKVSRSVDYWNFLVCAVLEFRDFHNERQGLVVGYDLIGSDRDICGRIIGCNGTLKGWDYWTGPDYVHSDHVFLGWDHFVAKELCNVVPGSYRLTIQFYVENLNGKRVDCCRVKECGVWDPQLPSEKIIRKQDPKAKRLKFSFFEIYFIILNFIEAQGKIVRA